MATRVSCWVVAASMLVGAVRGAAAQTPPPAAPAAQTAASGLVELRLKDGSVIYGTVQTETPERVVLRTIAGAVVDVERTQVASLKPARGQVVNGEFLPADANATRLLFSPTGRSLRKGEGYVGVYEFLLPFVQVGITDRFSMGAGTPLIFFGDDSSRPVWLTPKYQFYKSPKTNAAVGVMHFVLFGEDARFGLAYGVATAGSADNALTAGVGWAYARYHEDHYCYASTPAAAAACAAPQRTTETVGAAIVMIGGEHRISRRVKVVTENYAFENGGIASVGVRILGEHLSADLGFFVPLGIDEFVVAPLVNFVWTFGK